MRKILITGLTATALVLSGTLTAFAGGAGAAEVEPDVFVVEEETAAGSLGGTTGLVIGALLIGAVLIAGDSD